MDDDVLEWRSEGVVVDMVLDEGIDGVADQLAERYALLAQEQDNSILNLVVNDITTVSQYAQTLKYLRELDEVEIAQVVQVGPRQVTFRITGPGGSQAISHAIALGKKLVPLSDERDRLQYRLRP